MKNITNKIAQIVGVVFISAIASLSINFILSGMFAIITMTPLMQVVGCDFMFCVTPLIFVFFLILTIDVLISKK